MIACWACSPEEYFQLFGANTAQTLGELMSERKVDLAGNQTLVSFKPGKYLMIRPLAPSTFSPVNKSMLLSQDKS